MPGPGANSAEPWHALLTSQQRQAGGGKANQWVLGDRPESRDSGEGICGEVSSTVATERSHADVPLAQPPLTGIRTVVNAKHFHRRGPHFLAPDNHQREQGGVTSAAAIMNPVFVSILATQEVGRNRHQLGQLRPPAAQSKSLSLRLIAPRPSRRC